MNCRTCGAPGAGLVCAYCGSALLADVPAEQEVAVLDQYHHFLANAPVSVRVQFLRNGYMPRGEAALVEAGLRCLPFLNAWSGDEGADSPNDDAAARLSAVVARLRIVASSREGKAAVDEFSAAVKRYRKSRVLVYAAVFGGLLFVVLLGLLLVKIVG